MGSAEDGTGSGGFPRNIALIGFMGAGKSSVGRALAARLGMSFVDLDEEVAAGAGADVPGIFAAEGEEGFRAREHAALERALGGEGAVISCGGGVVLRDDNVSLLRERSRVFLLRISEEEAQRRLAGKGGRPLLAGGDLKETIAGLMRERAARYEQAAHEVIEAGEMSPEEIAEEIRARWLR